jgi:hypothetical protein
VTDIQTKVQGIIDQAKADGKDPVEQLKRAGLLLDDKRLMQIRVESMEQIIDMIDGIPAHVLLREAGQPSNLAEDYRSVLLAYLGDLAGKARGKWFR